MRPAVIIDLDGTLIEGNSFTQFTVFAFRRLIVRLRLVHAMRLSMVVVWRKLRLISHSEAKRRIMQIANQRLARHDFREFADRLAGEIRRAMTELMCKWRSEQAFLLLATAAPMEYAALLAERIGMDGCVATDCSVVPSAYSECSGAEKLRAVEIMCRRNQLKPVVVATDHADDLPLMQLPDVQVLLVAPSERTISLACSVIQKPELLPLE